jgi:glycosyltransferase involved in cell wall biosynthesis
MKQRILELVPTLEGGGAERQLGHLCHALVRRGWEVHVGALTGGANRELFESSGARLHWLPHSGNYDPALVFRLYGLTRRLAPALVQTWIPMMDVLGGCAARAAGVPWILTERSSPSMFPSSPKFWARTQLARGAAAVVSNSGGGDAYWRERLPQRVPRHVIGNALRIEAIRATPPKPETGFGLDDDRPLVLYVGRIVELKNIENLIDALARVTRKTDAVAVLCGQGTHLESARERVTQLGLSQRIAVPGFVADVTPLLRRAALFVSLSRYEGMPNAVMEALAARCPIVVSDIPAHREILDEAMARFVPTESAEAAADAMIETLCDRAEAGRRAAAAEERASAWSLDRVCDAYERLYAEVGGGLA